MQPDLMKPNPDGPSLDLVAHVVRALALYALAECQSGNANTLAVVASGLEFSVSDNGRGHAIHRTVDGRPYLQFIYTQLEYPFASGSGGTVQLQGIGMSLINSLCSELVVTIRKSEGSLRLTYQDGQLTGEEHTTEAQASTGNTVAGRVRSTLQRGATEESDTERWLGAVLQANPSLVVMFNGAKVMVAQHQSAA